MECGLCNSDEESANHLLIKCSFTKAVWHLLSNIFNLKNLWDGCTVSECLTQWSSDISAPVSLAAYTCWNIWLERNRVIFEDCIPSPHALVYRIAVSFTW